MRSNGSILAFGAGITALRMGLVTPVLPAYAASLGASAALIGLFLASFGFTRLLVGLPTGWLARRLGYRALLVGSPALIVPASVLCAVAGNFWSLALFCTAEGAAAAVYGTVSTAALAGENRGAGRSLALYLAAGLLGASVGPLLGGIIAAQFGPRLPFVIYALLAAFAAWWLRRELNRQPDLLPSPAPEARREKYSTNLALTWRQVVNPKLRTLWLLSLTLVFARVGTQLLAAPLLGTILLRLNSLQLGLALSLIGVIGLLGFYPAGWLADHLSLKTVIVGGGLVTVCALLVLAVAGNYPVFLAGMGLLGLGSSLVGPAPLAYLAAFTSEGDRPIGISLYRTFGDAGATLAPLLTGWLVDSIGYRISLAVLLNILLVAVALFAWGAPKVKVACGTPAQGTTRSVIM